MLDNKMQGPSISSFNSISPIKIPRSNFQRDFTKKGTMNLDYWIPWVCDEILPGDHLTLNGTLFARLTTLLKPIMDNIYLDSASFFVPNRLVFDNWEKLQGQQVNPGDSVAYSTPVIDHTAAPLSTTGFLEQSIFDYMDIPTKVTDIRDINAMPFRGINLIFNEFLRDQNLTNSLTVSTGAGPDDPALYAYSQYKSRKKKDYISSCLPWAQKGNPLTIPLGSSAPVLGIGIDASTYTFGNGAINVKLSDGSTAAWGANESGGVGDSAAANYVYIQEDGTTGYPNIYADLSSSSGITLALFRQYALYQQILELDARGGTRYVESVYSRFGVVLPDFRAQRPELIGQGSQPINVYAVPQTSSTSGSNYQGGLTAYGTSLGKHFSTYAAVEHGFLIVMLRARADLTYQQGIQRHQTRRTRYDYYEPLLNGMGEMTVLNREIRCVGGTDATTGDYGVFGYNEQFSDYRFKQSTLCGYFRSNATGTLDSYHLSEQFASTPSLNDSFIRQKTPIDRVLTVATASAPNLIIDSFWKYSHTRTLPMRSNPGIDVI